MIPFGGGGYIKAKDIKNNELVTFLNEGNWETTKFVKKDKDGAEVLNEDGTTKMQQQFIMEVEYNGDTRRIKITKASCQQLSEAYGRDTVGWIGKQASMMAIPCPNGKDKTILLTPVIEQN